MANNKYEQVLQALSAQQHKPFGAAQIVAAKALASDGVFPDASAALTFMDEVLLLDEDFKDDLETRALSRWTAMNPETKKSFNDDFGMYLSYLRAISTGLANPPKQGAIV